ncbi:thiamine phosphate synthase [uncultured Desulfuromonas sp.]|uniref:thiamine phosphate synthase n=1 Tax=uncultured Desulfuromonas sp. TaxID=181013 RepID=UPI002611DA97|nr:thiamine phosphate synthase [uncultured Desulfuromonas sp.]
MPLDVNFNLTLITDRRGLPEGRNLLDQLEAALLGGVRCVQLREKDLSPNELLPLAFELRQMTRAFGARLLVNGNIEIARAVDADGVHLGGDALPTSEARKRLGPAKLIGVSTHSVVEIGQAAADGADFVTFGPVFFTPSKAPYGDPVGLEKLRAACTGAPLPAFALGGVTADRIPELRAAGCASAACIGAILHAADPAAATRTMLAALSG